MTIRVGEGIEAENARWSFGGDTPKTFNKHVEKSVPLYLEGHDLICRLSDFFVHDQSTCYELGTSTGVLLQKLANHHLDRKGINWVGLDCEKSMIAKAKEDLPSELSNVSFSHEDIVAYPYEKSDFMVSYYTVQFIPPYQRQDLFDKVYESLNWGGAFLLFEKVRAADARFQDYMTAIYNDYKTEQGYSNDEIMAKSRSLKRVLEPFSSQGNYDFLQRAGFKDYMTVMKFACFEGILAIK